MGNHEVEALLAHGLNMPAPQTVQVRRDVSLSRIARKGVVLHPGTRLEGPETLLDEGAQVGTEGPAVLKNTALGRDATVASGSVSSATLLEGASLGPDAHVRGGSLLEEEASTGHAVGLKQTILLPFATLGSLINFCDCLLAGGTSRKDHSEVGSGFIHFNFTPFGASGDKATASLFGDVGRGAFLREKRIFLGGSGGVVGPVRIGYGSVLAAGSVYRRDYGEDVLVYGEKTISREVRFDPLVVRRVARRVARNLRYLGELRALLAFYRDLRIPRARDLLEKELLETALLRIESGLTERLKQVDRFVDGASAGDDQEEGRRLDEARNKWSELRPSASAEPPAFDEVARARLLESLPPIGAGHVADIRALDEDAVEAGRAWLGSIVGFYTGLMPE